MSKSASMSALSQRVHLLLTFGCATDLRLSDTIVIQFLRDLVHFGPVVMVEFVLDVREKVY